jgi:hypothetical protein
MTSLFAKNAEKLRESWPQLLEENYTEAAVDCHFIRVPLPGQRSVIWFYSNLQ